MTKEFCSCDLETGGTSAGCVVYSLGAVMYDADGLGAEFYSVLSAPSQRVEGLIEEPGTLLWWSRQNPEARAVLHLAEIEPEHYANTLRKFSTWWHEHNAKHFVALGSDFDGPILQALYKEAGIPVPWKFYEARCFRTMRALFPQVKAPPREGAAHNALSDARVQALHASAIFRHIKRLEDTQYHMGDAHFTGHRMIEDSPLSRAVAENSAETLRTQGLVTDAASEDLGAALARLRKERT